MRPQNDSVEDIADSYSDDELSFLGPLIWPPAIGDHVIVNFDTGFKIGEITDIKENDKVRITFMHPKPFAQAPPRRSWVWGHQNSRFVHKDYILSVHPVLEFKRRHSSKNCLVFQSKKGELKQNHSGKTTKNDVCGPICFQ